ncbi:MAG: Eco57I restriction-modification methylase domain-containing protein, partial [Nanoarchaeota archaeon]|nr:Eco57I restriction-modification methylase domain-containing protein [Nanoarchaeota archaeon]
GFLNEDREFFMNRYETAIKRFDIYNLFCEVGLTLIRNNGFNSFILPYPVLNQNYSEKLREVLLKKSKIYQIIDLSETKVFKDAIVRNCILVLEKDVNEGLCLDNIITIYKTTDSPNNLIMPFSSVSQKVYLSLPKNMFRIELSPDLLNLFEKINKISIKSVDICYVARGAVIHSEIENKKKEEYIGKVKINENFKPYIEGEDIERFSLVHRNLFLEYKPSVQYRPAFPELFENEKLLVYKVAGKKGLIVAYDNMNFYNNESLYNCILKYLLINAKITGSHGHSIKENEIEISKKYNLKYILSLFNSALLNIIYQKLYGYELNVYPDDIKNLPIRRISFTTPKEEREKLAVELKQKYQNENVDEILKMVEKCLPKDKLGNFLTEKEKSDVVHNFLAFLAEQMIEMNKEKNAEIKSFLDFLKGEIGASIEELSNKTAIQEYCKNEFQKLIEVLVKNKKKLRAGYDPKSPTSYKHLLEWYNASIDKLRPLMGRIEATDKIIDQIVYKLYGLTNEEIKIVEGNVSKKETSTS